MSNNTQPEIRFPGFMEDWEQRKLGELAESFEYGLNASAKKFDGSNKYIRITDIDDISHKFNQSGVTSPDIDFASADNYKLKKGDILFARTGASVGKTYMYRESDGLVYYAGFLIRARIKSKISSEFVFQTTFTDSYNRFIKITSQRSGQPGVNAEEYSNFKIMIPNYEEQNAIGCFFKKIDDTITLHQRKLDLLKETKKGFLQKMFPKNGAKVPEIRFPGFTEDWEERKLNEGMTEYTDRVYIQDDEIYKQVSVKNVGEITLRGEQIGSKIGRKRQAKVNLIEHPDTLIFTRQTIEQGGIGFAPKETDGAIVTENMPTIDVDNDIINCNYLLAYVKTEDWYRKVILKNIEGGTAQIAIHEDSILFSEVLIPKIEEQQKIGAFFKQLDDTITLHQRKLDLLKETKKGFLQKMFV
ncbi:MULTISPECIES: restriction endonuclease subunit S [Enterococcus]|uniref:Restriction endonuclease subunit S n=6 Tax=Enterococcus TaxID=1350 RepID=A0AAW8RWR6_ENTAV|nr:MULTISPECIES: restriction endonuclease subunit S [Enterococcus]EMF0205621.1 restriction endonuclease subunit S [Enterococcus hirae]EGO2746831.1 restriction endonuclease subunit S [Enterococcus faecalis]EGO2853602.1 restriction endonuclease subunit S [Enterococcus faecalis]EGO8211645.1 restriction endonuclease subunit S [Enterococcus faecalis]EGO8997016.1 restriction endonuclease subunit S [Enterococcus faecalis]